MNSDVIIVGAGPAGSTAAREIASRGKRVLLLDRARFPRDKPCGGAVTIRCANLLPFDLSPVIEDEVTGARIRLRNGPDIVRDHPHTLTYMTQRRRFDHYLVEQAQEAGVDFRDGQRVQRAERLGDGTYEVTVGANGTGGTSETHRAPVVLGADGANGVIATALGYEHPAESAVALEANLPCPDGVPDWLRGRVALQLGVMEGGYGWLFPKGDHVNVGVGGWASVVGTKLRPRLDALCASYRIDPARLVNMRGHHLPMQRRGVLVAAGGSALLGDAAGLVDPLTGEGIYPAIASGIAVARPVEDYLDGHTDSLGGYHLAVQRELIPEIEASAALMEIFHACPEPFAKLLQRSDRFWGGCVDLLRGTRSAVELTRSAGPMIRALQPLAALGKRVTRRRYGRALNLN